MIDTSSDVPAVRVASMTRGTTATVPKSTPTTCTTPSAMVSVRSLALHRTPTPLCAQVEMASLQRPARPGDRRTCAEALGALSGRASTLTGHAGARACDRHYSRKRDATRDVEVCIRIHFLGCRSRIGYRGNIGPCGVDLNDGSVPHGSWL